MLHRELVGYRLNLRQSPLEELNRVDPQLQNTSEVHSLQHHHGNLLPGKYTTLEGHSREVNEVKHPMVASVVLEHGMLKSHWARYEKVASRSKRQTHMGMASRLTGRDHTHGRQIGVWFSEALMRQNLAILLHADVPALGRLAAKGSIDTK